MLPIQSRPCESCGGEEREVRTRSAVRAEGARQANERDRALADSISGSEGESGSSAVIHRTRRISDRVELSRDPAGRSVGSEVRQDLVARVRAQIAAGEYDSPAKIEAAADRLARHLDLLA